VVAVLSIVPVLQGRIPILLTLLTIALQLAIVSSNWNLLFGYAGVWSLGQLGFFAIGAYSSALLSISGISPWLALLAGMSISLLTAVPLSLIALRLKATYFALATLGFQEVVRGFVVMIYPGIVFNLPHLQVGGFSFGAYGGIGYYYLFLALFLASLAVHGRIVLSRLGLLTVALRESEVRAISLGVEPVKVRTVLFLVSVVFTSATGSLYAHYTNSVSQSIVGFDTLLAYLIVMAFGGIGTFYGPTIASFIWVFADFGLRLYLTEMRLVVMGVIVIASLLFMRRGLVELFEKMATLRYINRLVTKRTVGS